MAYTPICKKITNDSIASGRILKCVKDGTPLPKGHGRLIDADDYLANTPIRKSAVGTWIKEPYVYDTIMDAPTVIEADQAGSAESPTPSEIRPTSLPVTTVISNGQELELPHTPKHGTLDVSTGKFSTEDTKHVEF